MEPRYREAIDNASAKRSPAWLADMPQLLAQGRRRDALGRDILRVVALALLTARSQGLWASLVEQASVGGLTVQSRPRVRCNTCCGEVARAAPCWRSAQRGEAARPMQDLMGVEGAPSREALPRALGACGREQSSARAARSCQDHEGWASGRTPLSNRPVHAARDAERSVEERRREATRTYAQALASPPSVATMGGELDGGERRTGGALTAAQAGLTDRPARQHVRVEPWRDARPGWARPLASTKQRLSLGRMAA